MIKVLIATINVDLLRVFDSSIIAHFETKNTSTFEISKGRFGALFKKLKDAGYNPYALMTW